MRIFLFVIDSFGIGAMPDAAEFGDVGSDTYGNIVAQTGLNLPFFTKCGLNNIDGVAKSFPNGNSIKPIENPIASFARLQERTKAKDTTAGHYEIAGLVLPHPFKVFPKAFPSNVVFDLEKETGVQFLGNEVASGTEIIQRLGNEHMRTKKPILYTSQDSVLQIAAEISTIPLERLYEICKIARRIMIGNERAVGRVIARPFLKTKNGFVRTEDRRDYSLEPPGTTLLDQLHNNGICVTAVGKIKDIFCGRGIDCSIHTGNNQEGLRVSNELIETVENGLIFVNLVDTDMLYGHRNNVQGYASALKEIDSSFEKMIKKLRSDDIFIVTADHGCDPTTKSTDHSREYVPLLILGEKIPSVNLGTLNGFNSIADFILNIYGLGDNSIIYNKIFGEINER